MSQGFPPPQGREYRLPRFDLVMGIISGLFFLVMGIFFTTLALLNPDGSFREPVLSAFAFAFGWTLVTLIPGWLILSYLRHRLLVTSDRVQLTGCWKTRSHILGQTTRARWNSRVSQGALVLESVTGSVKISFASYTLDERRELIFFFRDVLDPSLQEGWETFASCRIPNPIDVPKVRAEMTRILRFSVWAWLSALPVMYAILIWAKLYGADPKGGWLAVMIAPLAIVGVFLGMMVFCVWSARSRLPQTLPNPTP